MKLSIDSLSIYPLKSGAALPVEQISMSERGLWGDRQWMLVRAGADENNVHRFISQRDRGAEKLALVKATPHIRGGVERTIFDFWDEGGLDVTNKIERKDILVRVWNDVVHAREHTDLANRMFSSYLDMDCRLVSFDDDITRPVDQRFGTQGDHTAFADGFPLLVTSRASLEALSAEMDPAERVTMSRFRPNILLDGLEPFEEDTIKELQIGDTVIEFVKPCTRCVLTTVDQNTGHKPSKEPMQTLARVRRGMDKETGLKGVFFGQNAAPRQLGDISLNDEVKILSRQPMHPAVQQATLKFKG